MSGGIALAKVKALAVAEHARGHNISGSLLKRCKQPYFHCGYLILYGQMPPTPGLDAFYTRHGFDVLPTGARQPAARTSEPSSTHTACCHFRGAEALSFSCRSTTGEDESAVAFVAEVVGDLQQGSLDQSGDHGRQEVALHPALCLQGL